MKERHLYIIIVISLITIASTIAVFIFTIIFIFILIFFLWSFYPLRFRSLKFKRKRAGTIRQIESTIYIFYDKTMFCKTNKDVCNNFIYKIKESMAFHPDASFKGPCHTISILIGKTSIHRSEAPKKASQRIDCFSYYMRSSHIWSLWSVQDLVKTWQVASTSSKNYVKGKEMQQTGMMHFHSSSLLRLRQYKSSSVISWSLTSIMPP